MTTYEQGTIFDLEGKPVKQFNGGGDGHHYRNFQDAVRKRDHKILNADVEDGHLSSALCHLANISLRMGTEVASRDIADKLKDFQGPENMKACWERTAEHLKANNLEDCKMLVGPRLGFDPVSETFPNNPKANAMLTRDYRAGYTIPSEVSV
jgi:hypothetical protein